MENKIKKIAFLALVFLVFFTSKSQAATSPTFNYSQLYPQNTQGHAVGDINGDGKADVILAEGEFNKTFVWLKSPTWQAYPIDNSYLSTLDYVPDLQVADIDNDGDIDIVVPNSRNSGNKEIVWYANPRSGGGNPETGPWTKHTVWNANDQHIKDIEVADFDNDGKKDVAVRLEGNKMIVFYQNSADSWAQVSFSALDREGMAQGDINGDGKIDLVLNGYYFVNPGTRTAWSRVTIDSRWSNESGGTWSNNSSRVAAADINGDGKADPIITDSEETGPIIWYQASNAQATTFTAHTVTSSFVRGHSIQAADFNKDGKMDLLTANLPGSGNHVSVFLNTDGAGTAWQEVQVSNNSSYIMKVGDVNGDGLPDMIGSRSFDVAPMDLYINTTAITNTPVPSPTPVPTHTPTPSPIPTGGKLSLDNFTYISIDATRPTLNGFSPFGLTFADASHDGLKDVFAGRYAYINPGGNLTGSWTRRDLGVLTDAKLVLDINGNGNPDVIGNGPDNNVYWLESSNNGVSWTNHVIGTMGSNSHGSGQGYVSADIEKGGLPEIIFNGETVSSNIFRLKYFVGNQSNPTAAWTAKTITSISTEDGFDAGDIDKDGNIDIVTGTSADGNSTQLRWYKNPGNGGQNWANTIIDSNFGSWPDVTRVRDLDGDGDLDVIILKEGSPGEVRLYINNNNGASWTKSTIYSGNDVTSMDAKDMDNDGDIDIVVGQHSGSKHVLIFEHTSNLASWTLHDLGAAPNGGDHHLGTQLADLDNDGDLDIVSQGYDFPQYVHLWRNNAINGVSPTSTPTSSKPGDANNDNKVDGLDYVIWLNHYNQTISGVNNGNFNSDSKVDGLDYVIWVNNYGK